MIGAHGVMVWAGHAGGGCVSDCPSIVEVLLMIPFSAGIAVLVVWIMFKNL